MKKLRFSLLFVVAGLLVSCLASEKDIIGLWKSSTGSVTSKVTEEVIKFNEDLTFSWQITVNGVDDPEVTGTWAVEGSYDNEVSMVAKTLILNYKDSETGLDKQDKFQYAFIGDWLGVTDSQGLKKYQPVDQE